jgi:hypothetical protein
MDVSGIIKQFDIRSLNLAWRWRTFDVPLRSSSQRRPWVFEYHVVKFRRRVQAGHLRNRLRVAVQHVEPT